MSCLNKALCWHNGLEQDEMNQLLTEWAGTDRGVYIVPNLRRECFLPEDNMDQILCELHGCRSERIVKVEQNYQLECYKHIRLGGNINMPNDPTFVGRAVPQKQFIKYLRGRYHLSTREAENLLMKLISGDNLNSFEKKILLAQYTAWVTWNEKDGNSDPFSFARSPNRGKKIRASLGLDPRQSSDALLLFVFCTKRDNPLLYPTVADAGLYRFFQVAEEDSIHGWTRPWQIEFLKNEGINHRPTPKPEAVLEPQELNTIKHVKVA